MAKVKTGLNSIVDFNKGLERAISADITQNYAGSVAFTAKDGKLVEFQLKFVDWRIDQIDCFSKSEEFDREFSTKKVKKLIIKSLDDLAKEKRGKRDKGTLFKFSISSPRIRHRPASYDKDIFEDDLVIVDLVGSESDGVSHSGSDTSSQAQVSRHSSIAEFPSERSLDGFHAQTNAQAQNDSSSLLLSNSSIPSSISSCSYSRKSSISSCVPKIDSTQSLPVNLYPNTTKLRADKRECLMSLSIHESVSLSSSELSTGEFHKRKFDNVKNRKPLDEAFSKAKRYEHELQQLNVELPVLESDCSDLEVLNWIVSLLKLAEKNLTISVDNSQSLAVCFSALACTYEHTAETTEAPAKMQLLAVESWQKASLLGCRRSKTLLKQKVDELISDALTNAIGNADGSYDYEDCSYWLNVALVLSGYRDCESKDDLKYSKIISLKNNYSRKQVEVAQEYESTEQKLIWYLICSIENAENGGERFFINQAYWLIGQFITENYSVEEFLEYSVLGCQLMLLAKKEGLKQDAAYLEKTYHAVLECCVERAEQSHNLSQRAIWLEHVVELCEFDKYTQKLAMLNKDAKALSNQLIEVNGGQVLLRVPEFVVNEKQLFYWYLLHPKKVEPYIEADESQVKVAIQKEIVKLSLSQLSSAHDPHNVHMVILKHLCKVDVNKDREWQKMLLCESLELIERSIAYSDIDNTARWDCLIRTHTIAQMLSEQHIEGLASYVSGEEKQVLISLKRELNKCYNFTLPDVNFDQCSKLQGLLWGVNAFHRLSKDDGCNETKELDYIYQCLAKYFFQLQAEVPEMETYGCLFALRGGKSGGKDLVYEHLEPVILSLKKKCSESTSIQEQWLGSKRLLDLALIKAYDRTEKSFKLEFDALKLFCEYQLQMFESSSEERLGNLYFELASDLLKDHLKKRESKMRVARGLMQKRLESEMMSHSEIEKELCEFNKEVIQGTADLETLLSTCESKIRSKAPIFRFK
ncbi:hypothetical protein SOPP22_18700 [Shewanella sp. OPT22]|nr:hypothetical protein SOPP22_18700 [Shewanella sp. OPT22]